MTPDEIFSYWIELRRERLQRIKDNWTDTNWIESANEVNRLAVIHRAVEAYVNTFKPQG